MYFIVRKKITYKKLEERFLIFSDNNHLFFFVKNYKNLSVNALRKEQNAREVSFKINQYTIMFFFARLCRHNLPLPFASLSNHWHD
jgi:hypothetical protein